jgi:hypothetical protein
VSIADLIPRENRNRTVYAQGYTAGKEIAEITLSYRKWMSCRTLNW